MEYTIDGKTILTGLLGHPVAHSISPKMHNEAFQKLGLNYCYLAFDILPDQLPSALDGMKAMNIRGFNLTMPLKTAVIPYLDELSQASLLSNSVNTIINDNGKLIGHTTDGIGYMNSVKDAGVDIIGKKICLLGAGGAATSICTQAAIDGVSEIILCKRKNASYDSVVAFAHKVSQATNCYVHVIDMNDTRLLAQEIANSYILINATNVGMGTDAHSPIPKEFLRPDLIVSDIIYDPRMTTLLKDAAEMGCTYFNGMYMLLFQGAESFRLWTNHMMPIEHIKKICFTQED